MTIEILDEGCSKCKGMKENVLQAINDLELHIEIRAYPRKKGNLTAMS